MTNFTKTKKKMSRGTKIFIILMLAYPVLHFLISWVAVNFRSIMLLFQRMDYFTGEYKWVGFQNFQLFFRDLASDPDGARRYINSLLYMPVTCFISVPLATFCSYCLFKKMPCASVFRVIFFLPNVIPVIALTIAFRLPFDPDGFMYNIMRSLGYKGAFFGVAPNAQVMVFIYLIWAGLGYDVILLSGAMGRIPESVLESARLDGVGFFREFFSFTIPLVWPTLVTLNLVGMTTVLTVYLQPMLLTSGKGGTGTISMYIFQIAQSGNNLEKAATMGFLCSFVWMPVVLGGRKFLSRFFREVEY